MFSKHSHTFSKIVLGGLSIYFTYLFINALTVVNRRYLATSNGTYVNSTLQNRELYQLTQRLTENCHNNACRVQTVLNYVTNIPYKINRFTAHSPQQTIKENFGDCDDKSNLLISLLHELDIESYFVLVPKHIFVIASLPEFSKTKALYINEKPYYILESTAKNSLIGFPLQYKLDEIEAIIDPFENKKLEVTTIEYK